MGMREHAWHAWMALKIHWKRGERMLLQALTYSVMGLILLGFVGGLGFMVLSALGMESLARPLGEAIAWVFKHLGGVF